MNEPTVEAEVEVEKSPMYKERERERERVLAREVAIVIGNQSSLEPPTLHKHKLPASDGC